MTEIDFTEKTKDLIDSLKGISASYGRRMMGMSLK